MTCRVNNTNPCTNIYTTSWAGLSCDASNYVTKLWFSAECYAPPCPGVSSYVSLLTRLVSLTHQYTYGTSEWRPAASA